MAWSWSHTQEAYANAEANLYALPPETLREIAAEWCASSSSDDDADHEGFSPARYAHAYRTNGGIPADELAERIWDQASEQATCDNGGFQAWTCPYGCGPHTVSFSSSSDNDE